MRTLLLSSLLLATTLQAQTLTDQYIELTVSDTIAMVVKGYVYELNVVDDTNYEGYDENTDWEKVQREVEEKRTKALARLEKDVMGMGYSVERFNGSTDLYTLGGPVDATATTLRVNLKDQAGMKRLVETLRQRKDVSGNMVRVEYDRSKDAQGELLDRLYRRAEERSRALATLGGRKLGKLLQVRTPGEDEFTFGEFMRMMERERGSDDWIDRYGVNMPQRMTFRFALID
jgi:hypothetical protein